MSAFLRKLFSLSPPVGKVDNGGKGSSSPNHSETETDESKMMRLVKSAPSVLQKVSKEIPQIDARSLANDFNQMQQPPLIPVTRTLADTQVDVIEWYCHLYLMETNPATLTILRQELSAALVVYRQNSRMSNYGRLYNRLHLVALWNDMGCIQTLARRDDINLQNAQGSNSATNISNAGVKHATNISVAQWTQIMEQLVLVRGHLLRGDANLVVPFITLPQVPASTNRSDENENDRQDDTQYASNEQVANYDMFQQDYQHVVLLLQVQHALSCLLESLDNTSMDGTYQISESRHQRAVVACRERLLRIFENEENQSDDDESLAFLLHRITHQKRSGLDTDVDDESVTLLLRQDVTAICLGETHEFSHARLKQKVSQSVELNQQSVNLKKSACCIVTGIAKLDLTRSLFCPYNHSRCTHC
jgi:hypothetical protein